MRFEWDRLKDDENRSKHGVSFEEASTVFADPEEEDDLFRIISAREATSHERKAYEG